MKLTQDVIAFMKHNGRKGGLARVAKMTKAQLSAAGKRAVAAREKRRKEKG